jgi:archaellum component FlaF (FlaF/FlaG flagellin family)
MRKKGVKVFVSEYKTITSVSWICCSFFCGCLYTKSPIINERIDELNKYLYSMCRQCEYYYVDHSNISVNFSKDQVHMNTMREKMFLNNMKVFV